MKRRTPWIKHCPKCGRFRSKVNKTCRDGLCKPINNIHKVIFEDLELYRRNDYGIPYEDQSPYMDKAVEVANLVIEKQIAYGDAFGQAGRVLEILYPGGIKCEQYTDVLTIVRVLDKLFRIANQKEAFGEDPWKDITGYGLLSTVRNASKTPCNFDS